MIELCLIGKHPDNHLTTNRKMEPSKLRSWVRYSGRDRKFQKLVFETSADFEIEGPLSEVNSRRLVFYEMHEDGTRTRLREEVLDPDEAFEHDEFVELLAHCGWPDKPIRVYVTNPDITSDQGKNYLASKRFYPPLEYNSSKQTSAPAATAMVKADSQETENQTLIQRWNTPEGAEAIVNIIDRVLHSLGPLIVETIRESEQAKYEAKINYERQFAEIRARQEYQAAEARAGRTSPYRT